MEVSPLAEIITAILLLIPLVLGWLAIFRLVKQFFKTALNYSLLVLISIFIGILYFRLTLRIGFALNNETGILIDYASTWMILIFSWCFWPSVLAAVILFAIYLTQVSKR